MLAVAGVREQRADGKAVADPMSARGAVDAEDLSQVLLLFAAPCGLLALGETYDQVKSGSRYLYCAIMS
jgi:hypothetical protein